MAAVVVLVIAAVVIVITVYRIKQKVRHISRTIYGTESLLDGIKKQEEEFAQTPKSISGVTSLYLPQIHRDFPEFNYAEFKQLTQTQLKAILLSIDAGNLELMVDTDRDLCEQIKLMIEDNEQRNVRHCYEKITIHRTEITRYQKRSGVCQITLQSAVGHVDYVLSKEGTLVSGNQNQLRQTRYNVDLIYVQDYDLAVEAKGDNAVGLTCPNCGAPVRTLGEKQCEYCGTAITEVNRNVWKLHAYEEVV